MDDAFDETDALVRRTSAGDSRALEDLFSRHRERLRRMVHARLDGRLRAHVVDDNDVVQEIYCTAARRLDEYLAAPKLPFFLWLRGLGIQTLVDLHRKYLDTKARDVRREVRLRCRPAPEASSVALAAHLLGTCSTPSEHAQRAELKLRLEEALDSMDAMDREVLILRHYEELTHREIALELGIERSAASKRYFRALARIKRILSDEV